MINEIMAHFKDEGLEITFRMYSGYFDDAILETIESLGGKYVIYFFFITNTEKIVRRSG
jgi:hypothetical protein